MSLLRAVLASSMRTGDARGPWVLLACLLLVGCATGRPPSGSLLTGHRAAHLSPRFLDERASGGEGPLDMGSGGPASLPLHLVQGRLVEVDRFEGVLVRAGLNDSGLLPAPEADFTPEDAAELYDELLARPVTLAGFGPRLVAAHLLREVMDGEEELPRPALLARVARFEGFAVLRPDGYLAWALSGTTQQRVGPVTLKAGALRAGPFEVGAFYDGRSAAFFPVDERLQRVRTSPPLAEVYDDGDVINRALEGVGDAFRDTVLALGGLVFHPGDSLAALSQLPQGVAALVLHSPEYLERFRLMTPGEQIRTLSRLTVTVLATYGSAAGTTRTLGALGGGLESVSLPALSLSAEGTLVLERVALPVGRAVRVLGGGPGAAVVLHMANPSAQEGTGSTGSSVQAPQGPGEWGPVKESMSRRAARYQEQVSGRPVSESYTVRNVRFDGYKDGVLLEAKGPGYANKFTDKLAPKRWFVRNARKMVEQAQRQLGAANGTPIHWHVAEANVAEAIRLLFKDNGVKGVEVVHTPALP
ncbi:Tox-REase-5 domain-containing protein [Archangium violaceum]|uniref:Tox-REase-5 domain-containing protein n=1 Tax=Archangium violaceum TaxID=83451 RepID=UPI002B2C32A3|nr:Tox-REase-5 domain-containing protein [Archangium gephyra]